MASYCITSVHLIDCSVLIIFTAPISSRGYLQVYAGWFVASVCTFCSRSPFNTILFRPCWITYQLRPLYHHYVFDHVDSHALNTSLEIFWEMCYFSLQIIVPVQLTAFAIILWNFISVSVIFCFCCIVPRIIRYIPSLLFLSSWCS